MKPNYKIILVVFLLLVSAFRVKADTYNGTINTGILSTGLTGIVIGLPTSSPSPGIFGSAQNIVLTKPSGSKEVRFSTDGSTPDCSSSQVYSSPIDIDSTTTIKAISCYIDGSSSSVASFNYVISAPLEPDENGNAVIDNDTPQVLIKNQSQSVSVTIANGTTNPTINVGPLISGGTGTLPQITISGQNANIAIPATTITSADSSWNGVISAPTVTTISLSEGETLSTAIQVGFTGAKLSFDKAVRILLPGQVGKRAGYIRTGIAFTEITSVCSADNQTIGDALPVDGDCKIDVGGDLVIWTKHFTKFATYTVAVAQNQTSGGSSAGGGGGGSSATTTSSSTATTQTAATKPGDINNDKIVDELDFSVIMADWGKTGTSLADLNKDNVVDELDFSILMANWGS